MKKLLSIFICVLLLLMPLSVTAFAADEVALKVASDTVSVGKEIAAVLTLGDSGAVTADSIEISLLYSRQLKTTAGKFADFVGAESEILLDDRAATLTLDAPTDIKGEFFTLTLTADDIGTNLNLKFNITFKNGTRTVLKTSVSQILTAVCSEHKFSAWNTTAAADCEKKGSKTRVCSVCEFRETQEIEPLGHDFSDIEILREATCLAEGWQRAFCPRCDQKLREKIAPKGHSMGEWTTAVAPTCEGKGTEESKCSGCELVERRETEPLGHEFKEAVITTEPTIGKEGVQTGHCVRCNQATDSPVPCAHNDKATGIRMDTKKGVYPESAKAKITTLGKGSSANESVAAALAHITNQFYGYSIEVTNLGFAVSPNGEVTITFPVPEKFGKASTFYYITDENTVKKLTAALSEDGTTATVKFMGNGRYAICKTAYAADDEFISPASVNGVTVLILTVLVLLVCWGLVALKIIKVKNPKLYRRIMPTRSEVKNAIKRNIFVIKEKIKERKEKPQ